MPAPSREILTLRLIVECQLELVQDEPKPEFQVPEILHNCTGLLALPVELRVKILRYVLLFDYNFKTHTRRLPHDSINHLLNLDSRRILEAPQFKHKGKQEINGILPTYTTCNLNLSVLKVCRTLYWEGRSVVYGTNLVAAVQSGISGLGSRLRNYGVRVWGPLEPTRISGSGGSATCCNEVSAGNVVRQAFFEPVLTFRGQSSKTNSPVYICSQKDITHLLHALWILIKCPFARGMKFTVHVAPTSRHRLRNSMDAVVRLVVLPWMHNHIERITGTEDTNDSLKIWKASLESHRKASISEPNVYTYNTVCTCLEQLMASAEKAIEQEAYLRAETLHELVCYEACSIVRTRTGKLVDVSTKTKEGINRVCKLIAISAFRLAELRSGAIVAFKSLRDCNCADNTIVEKEENAEKKDDATTLPVDPLSCPVHVQEGATSASRPTTTTRLVGDEAIDHAILSALLALRLPCATPVPEWNIRLNLMLWNLFNAKNDREYAKSCIRRLYMTCSALHKDAKAKNKTGGKWADLEKLVEDLKESLKDIKGVKKRTAVYQRLVEDCQNVVRKIWGERLMPKKGYVGLIWTFRWA